MITVATRCGYRTNRHTNLRCCGAREQHVRLAESPKCHLHRPLVPGSKQASQRASVQASKGVVENLRTGVMRSNHPALRPGGHIQYQLLPQVLPVNSCDDSHSLLGPGRGQASMNPKTGSRALEASERSVRFDMELQFAGPRGPDLSCRAMGEAPGSSMDCKKRKRGAAGCKFPPPFHPEASTFWLPAASGVPGLVWLTGLAVARGLSSVGQMSLNKAGPGRTESRFVAAEPS